MPAVSSHLPVPVAPPFTTNVPRKPKLYLYDELPAIVLCENVMINIHGKIIKEEDYPHVLNMKRERQKGKKGGPVSPVGKIYLIKGLAGTGKTTAALSYLNNPLAITKTNNLKSKFIEMDLETSTSASFLRIYPVHTPFYELKPHYRGSERDAGEVAESQWPSCTFHDPNLFIKLKFPEDKKYLKFHRKIPVSMMTDFLRPYYNKVAAFKQRNGVSLSPKITQDLLFDDFGLEGEEVIRCWKRLFEAGAVWSKRIAFTFDENQLNYGGLDFINYIKEHYADRVEEITCYKEWRFEDSVCRWWWLDRFYSVPIISGYEQSPKDAMFVSHCNRYLGKARNTGGWSKKRSINIDKVQGREYNTIVVALLGLAALYRNKTPGYRERIYTTITRGKDFIFYVPRGTSRADINAAIRDVISALSEIERPLPTYDSSVLNLKTPRKFYSYMSSNLKRSRTRYHICQAAVGGTAVLYGKSENKERNTMTGSVVYRPARFWPEKPKKTALARLF
jgi:hypothetical protein